MLCRAFLFIDRTDRVAVSPLDFPPPRDGGGDFYILLNDLYVLSAKRYDGFPQGQLSLSDPQRTWASIALMDVVDVKLYDHFQEGGRYVGSIDAEVGFAARKTTETPFDQDDLAGTFVKVSMLTVSLDPIADLHRTSKTRYSPQVSDYLWITEV